ncbi:nuclear transport factor 2 family protein [Vibrio astriarenae]|uniref:Nuclear transport factor 2 family protein n=1 Tax=Vibrio astriarenae TaxID=1481923 RepID=A0A7Z2T2J4_9VIBR|nr:nuclear transport factor 2 family protein [Vibrio astriarenae]QIA63070.1 nuclear transport factor 2 family protein [Vibrio astriarenae]
MSKSIIKLIVSVALLATSLSILAAVMTQDEAKVRSNVQGFSALADQGAFEYLGRLFASEVTVDYTSLWGGEPATVSNVELMQQWAGFLPGFDTTFHELEAPMVTVQGSTATANVNFTARHWLGESGFWSVSGSYDFTLSKVGEDWVIEALKLNLEDETGSRDVLAEAPKFAVEKQNQREAKLLSY